MIPIPLGTRYYKNKSLPVSVQNLQCLYAEILDSDTKQIVLHQLPGYSTFASSLSGKVRGMHIMNGVLYVVAGTQLYSVNSSGTATSIGTIAGSNNVSMADNGSQLVIVNGTTTSRLYNGVTLSSVTLPFTTSTVRYSYGYFCHEETGTGTWFISDFGDGTTYDSTDAGSTNYKPDDNVTVHEHHGRMLVFGEKTISPWYNTASVAFPFSRINEAIINKGLLARWSLAEVDDTLIFLGHDREIYQISGVQYKRISGPSVSDALSKMTTLSDAEAWTFAMDSHQFYVLSFPTENQTFIYDTSTGLWANWEHLSNGSYIRHKGHNYIYAYGKHLIGDHTNGTIYELSETTYLNGADPIRWEFITPFYHEGGNKIDFPSLRIDLETGQADLSGQGSDPVLMVTHSSDGENFSSNIRRVSFGKTGEYNEQVWLDRNGDDYQRCWKVAWSDPVKTSISGMYLDANV